MSENKGQSDIVLLALEFTVISNLGNKYEIRNNTNKFFSRSVHRFC